MPTMSPFVDDTRPSSEHVLHVAIESWGINTEVRCSAGPDAECHNMPTCQCEGWDIERDERGWFHFYEEYVTGDETVQVKHRHTVSTDNCNICDWLNADDPMECLLGSPGPAPIYV